jgi:hypothetical protein
MRFSFFRADGFVNLTGGTTVFQTADRFFLAMSSKEA